MSRTATFHESDACPRCGGPTMTDGRHWLCVGQGVPSARCGWFSVRAPSPARLPGDHLGLPGVPCE